MKDRFMVQSHVFLILAMTGLSEAWAETPSPIAVLEDVFVEETWLRPIPDGRGWEAFIVLNNRSYDQIVLSRVYIDDSSRGRFVLPSGAEREFLEIPTRAELYMQPGGVRVIFDSRQALTEPVQLQLELAGGPTISVPARVLQPGEALPDHHDYPH